MQYKGATQQKFNPYTAAGFKKLLCLFLLIFYFFRLSNKLTCVGLAVYI